jgi:aminoglycoside phosphotransferase (APT) family kinase protein
VPPSAALVLSEVNDRLGSTYRWQRQLTGGEQSGAHLVLQHGRSVVLKWEPAGGRADQLLRAFPAVVHATDGGWPAARWLEVGPLSGGGAFVLQEYVEGTPVSRLDAGALQAVVAANTKQQGLALADAFDDSNQLEGVLSGAHDWKAQVRDFTPAGAALVRHGDEVAVWAGQAPIPTSDVIHGDYSSTNLLLDADGSAVTFVDCQTVGRGSRVRDLADLYRQSFVHPRPENTGLSILRAAAVGVAGPQVFARCAVAVTYNNLAWWVEHQPRADFDRACARLHALFDDLRDELA